MSSIFIFPGQGSQTVGMGKDLYDNSAAARAVFDEIDDVVAKFDAANQKSEILNYFVPHAGQMWCGRFFSPHFLQVPAGITGSASWARRCLLRALLVFFFGTAIFVSFVISRGYFN